MCSRYVDGVMERLATVAFLVIGAGLAEDIDHTKIPVNANSELRHIESCPNSGYFFHRDVSLNALEPGPCFLCFCRDNHTAVCWLREDNRCDDNQFHHQRVPRNTRARRSPLGLSDIFFRDATRDFFNKKLPQQCKPHEGSFSEGCPPADWCVGCTVCDCDANGRWDCHVLSFCDGKHNNKKKRVAVPNIKGIQNKKKVVKRTNPKPQVKYNNSKPKKSTVIAKNNNIRRNVKKPMNGGKNQPKRKQNIYSSTKKRKPQIKKSNKKTLRKFNQKQPKQNKTSIKKQNTRKIILNSKNRKQKIPNFDQKELEKSFIKNGGNESELGRKIIKTVMTSVQNMIAKQVAKMQNTSRLQRSVSGQTGCSKNVKVKKNNPIKSKVKNKKNSNKKKQESKLSQRTLKRYKNLFNSRMKREVSQLNTNEDSGRTEDRNMTMTGTANGKDTVEGSTSDVPLIQRSTDADTVYYKYTIHSNMSNSSINKETNQTHNYVLDLITSDKANNIIDIKAKQDELRDPKYFNVQRNVSDEIKKPRKTKSLKTYDIVLKYRTVNNNNKISKISKHKLYGQDIKRKIERASKRYLRKMIFPNFKDGSINYFDKLFQTKKIIRNISHSNSLINNSLLEKHQNQSKQKKPEQKTQYNVFNYLRSIIRMLFNHSQYYNMKKHKTNEGHTLEVLCNNNEACYTNAHNKLALRNKLHDLNTEAETIFNAIKVIKVLLPNLNNHIDNENKTNKYHNNDMIKLEAVLRGTHKKDLILTVLQETQVSYVKQKIQTFIHSVGKFSSILHEILDELYKNNKTYSCQRNMRRFTKKKKLRFINNMKNLLVKYNILQNTFMKNMYKLLTNVEKNTYMENSFGNNIDSKQVSDKYSNIIENLLRLKNLAQTFHTRKKRHTIGEDDTMEYLLTLMDYLLRQNRHLNTDPANDGIDLLIEAIQNAPQIKSINKKVLEYFPTTQIPTRHSVLDVEHVDDYSSKSDTFRVEENEIKTENVKVITQKSEFKQNGYRKLNDSQTFINDYDIITNFATRTESIPFIKELNNRTRNMTEEKPEKIQERTGFDKLESIINDKNMYEVYNGDSEDDNVITMAANITEFANDLEDETSTSVLRTTPQEIEDQSSAQESEIKSQDKVNEPIEHVSRSTTKEAEDAAVIQATRTTYDFKLAETMTTEPIASIPMQDYKLDDDDGSVIKNKTKLDWIEENFENEIREYSAGINTIGPTLTQATTVKQVNFSNKQNIRVAVRGEEIKKRKSNDEVMHLKEIQFLTSLDYGQGTEKPEFEETDTKEEVKDEDAYMSYV